MEAFRPRRTDDRDSKKTLTIGFVGRMLPGKGLDVLGRALAQIKAESWSLLVVGDGPERDTFAGALAANDLMNRVRFTGAVSYDSVPDSFNMDFMVCRRRLPSGFANSWAVLLKLWPAACRYRVILRRISEVIAKRVGLARRRRRSAGRGRASKSLPIPVA